MLEVFTTQRALLHSDRGYCSPLDLLEGPRLLRCTDGCYREFSVGEHVKAIEKLQLTDGTFLELSSYNYLLTIDNGWKSLRDLQKKQRLRKFYPDSSFYIAPFETKYDLEEVTYTGSGNFNISTRVFAELSGRYVRSNKKLKNGNLKLTKPSTKCYDFIRRHSEAFEKKEDGTLYMRPSWLMELMESFYGCSEEVHYIPDEIVFTAPNAWLTDFIYGLKAGNKKDGMKTFGSDELSSAVTNILLRLNTSAQFIRLSGENIALLNVEDTQQSIHLGEDIAQAEVYSLTTSTGIPDNVGLWMSGYGVR